MTRSSQTHGRPLLLRPLVTYTSTFPACRSEITRSLGFFQLFEQPEPLARLLERLAPGLRHFVILARRSLLGLRATLLLPLGPDEGRVLQPPQRRIDRSTRQPRHRHNFESITIAILDRLQNERHRVGKICFAHPSLLFSNYRHLYI